MIVLKSRREIALMREAGRIVAEAHERIRQLAVPGVSTAELNRAVEEVYRRYDAEPLFKGVTAGKKRPPFPAVICTSINEEVVHGIPGKRQLREGDILSVDTGCRYRGWCGDAAVTLPIGEVDEQARQLIEVARETLELAIQSLAECRRWSEVARRMQRFVRRHGFSLVEKFVGHGIGRKMHEEPQVPNFVSRAMLRRDFRIEPGLVLAIEPMVNAGSKKVRVLRDRWTVITADGRLSAHFEHTVAVTENGPEILTRK